MPRTPEDDYQPYPVAPQAPGRPPPPSYAPPPPPVAPPPPPRAPIDRSALLRGTSVYTNWATSAANRKSAAAARRAAAIRTLIGRYGKLPSGYQDSFGDLRPEDIAAAQNDPLSSTAQLAKAAAESRRSAIGQLAARGGLGSGELGYTENNLESSRATAERGLLNSIMDALTGTAGGYTDEVNAVDAEEPGVLSQAEDIVNSMYQEPASAPAPAAPPGIAYQPQSFTPTFGQPPTPAAVLAAFRAVKPRMVRGRIYE